MSVVIKNKQVIVRLVFALILGFCTQSMASEHAFECLIVPNQTVELRSPTDGLIDKIHVNRGDQVKQGQVLVELESSVQKSSAAISKYRASMSGRITSSQVRLDFAKKKFSRTQELQKKNLISEQLADEAQAELNVAEAELAEAIESQELAKRDYLHSVNILQQRTLKSPFPGVVVDRLLNPGDLAESGTGPKPILKLAQIDPLLVEVAMPLHTFGKIQSGMTGRVIPEGQLDRQNAKVKIVDSVFDAASGMYGVVLEMNNKNAVIPSGIRCQVQFEGV